MSLLSTTRMRAVTAWLRLLMLFSSLSTVSLSYSQSPTELTVGDVVTGNVPTFYQPEPPQFATPPGGIRVEVLKANDFMTPDSIDEVLIEIINPADSGHVIHYASGSGTVINSFPYVMTSGQSIMVQNRPTGCSTLSPHCVISGEFPVQPGESMVLAYKQIWSDPSVPDNTFLVLNVKFNLHLAPETGAVVANASLQPIIRVLNHTGSEDPEVFTELADSDELVYASPADVDISLIYPSEVRAGDRIPVYATIRNTGQEALFTPTAMTTNSISGSADMLYLSVPCSHDCVIAGPQVLQPGDEALVSVAELNPVAGTLISGEVSLNFPHVVFQYENNKTARNLITESIEISVTTDHDEPIPNPVFAGLPTRKPLQLLPSGFGVGQVIHDPVTGNDWIPLDDTRGFDMAQLAALQATGQVWEGFDIAHSAQVETLLLNHLQSSSNDLTVAHLYNIDRFTSAELSSRMARFFQLSGTTDERHSWLMLRGLVRDPPRLSAGHEQQTKVLSLNMPASNSSAGSGWGLHLVEESDDMLAMRQPYTGIWLVRDRQGSPQRPADIASYADYELVIPDVVIDGQHHRVALEPLSYADLSRWRVSQLQPHSGTDHALEFDTQTLRLTIPEAMLLVPGSTPLHYSLELEYLPASDPPILDVVSLIPLD